MQRRGSPDEWAVLERPADADFDAWLDGVRARPADELAAVAPIDVESGSSDWPAALTVRFMLADLDHYADFTPEQRCSPATAGRRLLLLEDSRRPRGLLG